MPRLGIIVSVNIAGAERQAEQHTAVADKRTNGVCYLM